MALSFSPRGGQCPQAASHGWRHGQPDTELFVVCVRTGEEESKASGRSPGGKICDALGSVTA